MTSRAARFDEVLAFSHEGLIQRARTESGVKTEGVNSQPPERSCMSTAPSEASRKVTKERFLAFAHGHLNWDDFENIPLHGTFLIDTRGRIRWQEISYTPFMEPKFLLEESRRLLAIPK